MIMRPLSSRFADSLGRDFWCRVQAFVVLIREMAFKTQTDLEPAIWAIAMQWLLRNRETIRECLNRLHVSLVL